MNVLFVFPSSLRSIGGVSNWAREIIPRLFQKRIDIKIYASTFVDGRISNETILKLKKTGIFYKELPVVKTFERFYVIPFTKQAFLEIKKSAEESDIIYTQNMFVGQDKQMLELMHYTQKPIVVGYHTPIYNKRFFHDLIVNFQLMKNWKKFSAHHALTPQQRELLVSHGYNNVYLIPNGVDTENYSYKPHIKSSDFTILFLGRLEKQKGVNIILDCARELCKRHNDIKFLIAGDGFLRSIVSNFTKKYKNVIYYGFVTEKEKIELYQKAHIFVLPSKAEGLPLTILEALASGLFIISSSDYGVVPHGNIINENITSKDYLLSAIMESYRLWKDSPEEFNNVCKKNRKIAESYDWREIAKRLLEVIANV